MNLGQLHLGRVGQAALRSFIQSQWHMEHNTLENKSTHSNNSILPIFNTQCSLFGIQAAAVGASIFEFEYIHAKKVERDSVFLTNITYRWGKQAETIEWCNVNLNHTASEN